MPYTFNPFTGSFDYYTAAAAAGSSNSVAAEVDFGAAEAPSATVTVSASWVTSSTKLVAAPFAVATADHDPDDYAAEGITAMATNIVDGVGFDVIAQAPNGTWGKYVIHTIGV